MRHTNRVIYVQGLGNNAKMAQKFSGATEIGYIAVEGDRQN